MHIPSDAKVLSGDGIVTGGHPVLLAAASAPVSKQKRNISAFSWFDDDDKVKIYLDEAEFVEEVKQTTSLVQEFTETSLRIETETCVFAIDALDDTVDVAGCALKVGTKRVTVVLKKTKKNKTWYSLKTTK